MRALRIQGRDPEQQLIVNVVQGSHPYVWIGYEHGPNLASIEPKQMNALVRRWQQATRNKGAADAKTP